MNKIQSDFQQTLSLRVNTTMASKKLKSNIGNWHIRFIEYTIYLTADSEKKIMTYEFIQSEDT